MRPAFLRRGVRGPHTSLLMGSATARVAGALLLVVLLWVGVLWTLR